MRILTRLLIGLVLLVAAGLLAYRMLAPAEEITSPSPSGVPALFAATFPDQDGKAQALSQWRGKVVVVNFWATWCPPCKEEMPELSHFQEKYRARDVVVLGISTDDVAKIREFAQQEPVQYILGETEFCGLKLKVDRRALIPRPETEALVERVVTTCSANPPRRLLDLGTGTGAIGCCTTVVGGVVATGAG